jgi:fatty acid CoA ligase FadD9
MEMAKRSIYGPAGGGTWPAEAVARRDRRIAQLSATDAQFAATKPDPRISEALGRPGQQLAQVVRTAFEGYADRPALASRAFDFVTNPETGRTSMRLRSEFETISYRQVWERASAVAGALAHDERYSAQAGDRVCTLGFTGVDYVTVDVALTQLGAIAVPLQTGATAKQLSAIVAETKPAVFAVSAENLEVAVQVVLAGPTPKRLVVFDHHHQVDEQREALEQAKTQLAGTSVAVQTLEELIERGRTLPPVELPETDDNSTALLIYTSGSTGTPKGAMHSERVVAQLWSAPSEVPIIALHYLPLSHWVGLAWVYATLAAGGVGYFTAKSDQSTLLDDLAAVRPTMIMVVPRIWDLVIQEYRSRIDRRIAAGEDPAAAEQAVKAGIREHERIVDVFTIGSPDLLSFYASILGMPLTEVYGATELAGVIMLNGAMQLPPVVDYKFVDVPELGYFRTDRPHPRGELCVKTETMFAGYYQRPEVSASVLDPDGFYKTGDIFAEIAPDRFEFVDRRNDVFKLSQGEFVSATAVEGAYASSPLIDQVYIYGTSAHASVLAVIVPTREALDRAGEDVNQLRQLLADALREIAKGDGLQPYELPPDFLIETEPFSTENGLISASGKIARAKLKDRYGERLEQMYARLAEGQAAELQALRQGVDQRPVLETVLRTVAVTLGISATELNPELHFTDLGGDSLLALSLSNHLGEIFGLEVPVSVVINAANDLAGIAGHIDALRRGDQKRPTFASVHGAGAKEIHAGELTLEKFIDADVLATAPTLPRPSGPVRAVLLTGANGFLGRFLALEWLQRLAPVGGKVIVVVRGKDDAAARARLDDVITSAGDDKLTQLYRELSAQHLQVLAGDLGEPRLGLDEATWDRLAAEVDLVFHAGALVNHVLPYQQEFGPNVAGTAELIGLALTTRLKRFAYVSTNGVPMLAVPPARDEDVDIRVAAPTQDIARNAYSEGYGISKWAGEVLVRNAHDLFGLPVTILRPDMILAPDNYSGQFNQIDVLTRMLFSVLVTGIAPYSFYALGPDGQRQRAHYDGMPVNFMAEAMAALCLTTDEIRGYNVLNLHDDGVGLDQFIDWLIEAGYPIQRIADYDEWLSRIEIAMRALPDAQRQHSMLMVLDFYRRPEQGGDGYSQDRVNESALSNEKFRAAVQAEKVGEGDIPHLTKDWLLKYATDMKHLGWL